VWQDTRTDRLASRLERDGHGELIRARAGLRPATYFSGGKLAWLLENVDGLRRAADAGDALFGTADTWLLWNLTGGVHGGVHVTDVTNASRTMLCNLDTLDWDDDLLALFDVPRQMLPTIAPSSSPDAFGVTADGTAMGAGVAITGVLGDQHAATVGQVCFEPGQAKNTYGTGNFLLANTGTTRVRSEHGLLTTVAYQWAGEPAVYALEGSIAVTGSAIQWLRDQLGIISGAADSEQLARQVPDNGGVSFVPAFSGLFAPYWRSDARGVIVGLSRFNTNAHLARATLEAICFQSRDVADAMTADSGVELHVLKVDGGVTQNDLCMQIQADVLGVPVSRPVVAETTALGAAYAAGLAVGVWGVHRRADRELAGGATLGTAVVRRPARISECPMAQGRRAILRLDRRQLSRPAARSRHEGHRDFELAVLDQPADRLVGGLLGFVRRLVSEQPARLVDRHVRAAIQVIPGRVRVRGRCRCTELGPADRAQVGLPAEPAGRDPRESPHRQRRRRGDGEVLAGGRVRDARPRERMPAPHRRRGRARAIRRRSRERRSRRRPTVPARPLGRGCRSGSPPASPGR